MIQVKIRNLGPVTYKTVKHSSGYGRRTVTVDLAYLGGVLFVALVLALINF